LPYCSKMEHHIKVKIADRSYRQVIHTEDEEAAIRKAAQSVNDKITALSQAYGSIPAIDILSIVALNESIEKIEAQRSGSTDQVALERLSADLQKYVDSLK